MANPALTSATGFLGSRMVASGPLGRVAPALRAALDREPSGECLAFDDATGTVIDLDLRGSVAEVGARYVSGVMPAVQPPPKEQGRRSPGRPRLGVVGKELTLLPRHWDWLAAQPGGASATVRRLIDQARKAGAGREHRRRAQEAAYGFIRVLGGNLEGFEEVTRALFAGDGARFAALLEDWPEDVAAYARRLAEPGFAAADVDR